MKERTCKDCGQRFLSPPGGRNPRCCRCRAGFRPQTRFRRATDDPRAFQDENAVRAYLDHDRLTCLLCGGAYAGLGQHLRRAHGVQPDDYRVRFGIPQGHGLVGQRTRVRLQATAVKTQRLMAASEYANLVTARSRLLGRSHRLPPDYLRSAHARRLAENPKHLSHQHQMVRTVCVRCGGDVYVEQMVAVSWQCRLLCATCRAGR